MTMIDEDRLRTLLGDAADAYPIPEGAVEQIVSAASEDARPGGVVRAMVPQGRWSRAALVAAAAVIVAGSVAVFGGSPGTGQGQRTAAGPSVGAPGRSGTSPSTTVPFHTGPASGANAPFGVAGGTTAAGSSAQAAPAPNPGPANPSPAPLPTGVVGQPAKVVTTGSIYLALGSAPLAPAVTRLTAVAAGAGGFVASSSLQVGGPEGSSPSSGTVVLQVPQASFAAVLAQVRQIAKVTSMTTASTDVTGQYVDLQARIDALQASRLQYLTILSKATSIGDILAVQSQLDTIQSQIEQLQGQLNLLDSQTTYATLTVSLSQSGHRPVPPPVPQSGLGRAWHQSVDGFTSGLEWLVRIAGRTVFVLLCLALLAVVGRWAWRLWRRQML